MCVKEIGVEMVLMLRGQRERSVRAMCPGPPATRRIDLSQVNIARAHRADNGSDSPLSGG